MDVIIKMYEYIFNIIKRHRRHLYIAWLLAGVIGLSIAAADMTIDNVVLLGLAWAFPAAMGLAVRASEKASADKDSFTIFAFISSIVVFELLTFLIALVTRFTVWPVGAAIGIALILMPQLTRLRLSSEPVEVTGDVEESVPAEGDVEEPVSVE